MTTHNTHSEHNDVDTSVAEYPSAPETTVDPTSPEAATSAEDTLSSSPELPSASVQEEPHQEKPSAHEVPTETPAIQENPETADPAASTTLENSTVSVQEQQATAEAASDTIQTTSETSQEELVTPDIPDQVSPSSVDTHEQPAETAVQQQLATPEVEQIVSFVQPVEEKTASSYIETTPLVQEKVAELRPFTDFIEEFRQAEAARLQATLNDSQAEAFSLLSSATSITASEPATTAENVPLDSSSQDTTPADATPASEEVPSPTKTTAPQSSEENSLTTQETSTTPQAVETETPTEIVRPNPPERAVSPLLRPASRLRIPRHGARHQPREEAVVETPAQVPPVETPVEPAPVETPAALEPTRPTRRYRFDRPAKALAPAAPTNPILAQPIIQPRTEEVRAAAPVHPELTEQISAPVEQASELSKTVQEQPAAVETSSSAATQPTHETGRRRHSHKEQTAAIPAAPTPVIEAVTPVVVAKVEAQVKAEEIAPEDLPPLEYSELQKVSSRRRRRHRSSPTPTAPIIPSAPAVLAQPIIPPVAAPAPTPIAPIAPVIPPQETAPNYNSNYTIVSGYTVNQMNQGNDMTGPFMAPEPSPARGSVFTRDGRTQRAESQRTATPSSAYPTRSNDNGFSSANLTQFANIVSQAIQTQTDRMVTELRRSGQSPTSVSVTLPPFPSTERVGVFVDVANLLYSARTLRIAVDFGKLLDFLRGNRRLVRAQAYCPTSPQPGDEQMFLQAVKGLGYRITTKNYKTFSSGAKKADLDLDLCMDVVRLVDGGAVDCVVLVSGDSDFMPMLDYCSDHGVRVEVAAFDEAMSATLRQSCDLFVNLSMLEEIRA